MQLPRTRPIPSNIFILRRLFDPRDFEYTWTWLCSLLTTSQIIGPVNTMLSRIYPDAYAGSSAQANVASITFAGTVLGMLFFGYTSDHFSRKWSLFVSTIIIILFAALGAGSYGAGGSPTGLLAALVAYRFFLGIGKLDPPHVQRQQ
jgi:MFS family permease